MGSCRSQVQQPGKSETLQVSAVALSPKHQLSFHYAAVRAVTFTCR
jgi:hypothetical protein